MARISKEAKAASRIRIVDEASRLLRQQGIEATGVAEIMSAAGMTHGGFYRYFSSKEELVCIAIETALDHFVVGLEREIQEQGAKATLSNYVKRYLSEPHVAMRGEGCPIAALGSEASLGPASYQQAITNGTERIVNLMAQGFEGAVDEKRLKAMGLINLMIGTVVLARASASENMMKDFLRSGREAANGFIFVGHG